MFSISFRKLIDELNPRFPLRTAHEWYALGYDAIVETMKKQRKGVSFDGHCYYVCPESSDKEKELLIAFNTTINNNYHLRPSLFFEVIGKYGLLQGDVDIQLNGVHDLKKMINGLGIRLNSDEKVPCHEINKISDRVTINCLKAYNEYLDAAIQLEDEVNQRIERKRLAIGLPSTQ